jgi:hypothetical protein
LLWRPDASIAVYPAVSSLRYVEVAGSQPAATSAGPTPAPSGAARAAQGSRPEVSATPTRGASAPAPPTTTVTVRTPVQARIDEDGRYTLAAPGATLTRSFTLVRVGRDWRISSLDDGILISRSDFDVTYRPYPVYFADPSGRYLVPDVHWFAGSRDQPDSRELPTALVRFLLEGPPPWLQGAVITGAPVQTRMAVAAVVVSGDTATVDLTDQVRAAKTRQRQLLLAQLEATLGQLSTISRVQITVQRLAFDVPSGSGDAGDPSSNQSPRPVSDPQVDNRPVVIYPKGRLARLDGGELDELKDVGGLAVSGANHPAVSSDSSAYAVLNGARDKLLLQLPGTKVATLVKDGGLIAPSFDPQGWVWTAPTVNGGWVYAAAADPGPIRVRGPWLKRYQIVGLRISRDGTRAAVVIRYRGQAHLFISGVIRDAAGRPTGLTEPLSQIPDLRTVKDVAWVDEDRVVVLGRRKGTIEAPWVVQIGGDVSAVSAVPGAESITAGNGQLSLMVGTSTGLLTQAGARWERTSAGRWPAFPG